MVKILPSEIASLNIPMMDTLGHSKGQYILLWRMSYLGIMIGLRVLLGLHQQTEIIETQKMTLNFSGAIATGDMLL